MSSHGNHYQNRIGKKVIDMRCIDADALEELFREVIGGIAKKPEMNGNLEHMVRASAMVIEMIQDAPTIEPHCETCEAFNKTRLLIPQPERKKGKWIDYTEDGYVECPFCHSATNCDGNKDELHFCFSCGADMRGELNG